MCHQHHLLISVNFLIEALLKTSKIFHWCWVENQARFSVPKGSAGLPSSIYVWNCPQYALKAFSYLQHMESCKHKNVALCTKALTEAQS